MVPYIQLSWHYCLSAGLLITYTSFTLRRGAIFSFSLDHLVYSNSIIDPVKALFFFFFFLATSFCLYPLLGLGDCVPAAFLRSGTLFSGSLSGIELLFSCYQLLR